MKYLFLLLISCYFLNASVLQRDNTRNVVIDYENKLMWEDRIDNMKLMLSHKEAEPYCEKLNFAGYNNWRLPHIDEFKLIVDKRNKKNFINKAFRYNQKGPYWAETAHFRTFWFYADYMHFISGTAYYDNRNKKKFIRCVRDIK